jgi:hypothetical protein
MATAGYQNYQGFPLGNTPVVDPQGNLTLPWARFFISLWQRAGTTGTLQQSLYLVQNGSAIQIVNSATGTFVSNVATVSSVGMTVNTGLLSVSGSPITGVGSFNLTIAGNTGGIPYFNSSTSLASSFALGQNQLVLGGGAGAPNTPVGLGTATTVLHGNAGGVPSFGAVNLNTDIAGTLPVANGGTGLGGGYTVAGLPGGQATGTRTWVVDASAGSYSVGSVVTGGGANVIPVFYNGSAWVAG